MGVADRLVDAVGAMVSRSRGRLGRFAAAKLERLYKRAFNYDVFDPRANGEYALLRRLRLRERPCTVFDVGANVGDWSVEAARAWPGARVHCFEVCPTTCEKLRKAVAENGLTDRVRVNPFGLSDAPGELTFYEYEDSTLCSSTDWHAGRAQRAGRRPVVRGDDYCRENGVEAVDFLKVDVEGAELAVLRGFAGLLGRGAVTAVQFEYGAFAPQQRILLRDFYDLLGKDYRVGRVLPAGVEFADYSGLMETARFSNFLALRKDALGLLG
jgi:FkbM family methyltransferase